MRNVGRHEGPGLFGQIPRDSFYDDLTVSFQGDQVVRPFVLVFGDHPVWRKGKETDDVVIEEASGAEDYSLDHAFPE